MNDRRTTEEKMERLTAQRQEQFAKSARLEQVIRDNLARLGYE
jgi:type I restriction enzyme M protein